MPELKNQLEISSIIGKFFYRNSNLTVNGIVKHLKSHNYESMY